jgi:hypothetical protein
MAAKKLREGGEGYTQFADPMQPYNKPYGLIGRFFKKFFSREVEDHPDYKIQDPITKKRVDPPKPLQGDTIQSKDIIKVPSEFGRIWTDTQRSRLHSISTVMTARRRTLTAQHGILSPTMR